jgi:hypothetical protein
MTYRSDGEVSDCSYGCTYSLNEATSYALSITNKFKNEFDNRKNSTLWFVSNCGANLRQKLSLSLGKLYPIKIFGKCKSSLTYLRKANTSLLHYYLVEYFSQKSTPKDLITLGGENCSPRSSCEFEEFKSNKYYLSFESKNCSSYITEKLWRILRTGMIPIVIQPNKLFYEQVAPLNSIIHMQDFDYDAAKLASYLKKLDSSFDSYMKHHMWRFEYDVVYSVDQNEKRRLCELCTKLNTEKSIIYYENISEWFNGDCVIN